MKKGFTLLEMLAVIVIISILVLVLLPVVTKNTKDSKENVYNSLINKIISASSDWMIENSDLLPEEGESISITLGMLQSGGYISTDLKNPKTDNLFPSDMVIIINYVKSNKDNSKLNYGKYNGDYSIVVDINSGTEIKDIKDEYTIVELNLSDTDVDSIVYKDKDNNDITLKEYSIQYVNNGINVEKVDSSKVGIYYVYYTKLDGNKKFTRVFNVSDTSLPEIVFPTDDTVSISVSTFDLYNNVECNDNSNICNLKITEGESEFYSALSNKETGNYVVKYEASDAYGNKTTKNRVIEITE